jgi:hypothetical protein
MKYRCWIVIAPVRRGAREPVPPNCGIIFTQIITEKTRRLVRRGGFLGIHSGGLFFCDGFFAAWRLCAPKTSLIE